VCGAPATHHISGPAGSWWLATGSGRGRETRNVSQDRSDERTQRYRDPERSGTAGRGEGVGPMSVNGTTPFNNYPSNGNPSLHALLLERMAEAGVRNQAAMTIMAPHRDPYRQEKYRPEAQWLVASMERIPHRPVHIRGLHYAAIDTLLPNGVPYTNTEASYEWMQNRPAKAARWLGLVPWTDIVDKKNDEPRVKLWTPPAPESRILFGNVEISFPADLAPEAHLEDFRGEQAYKLVVFAEKAAVGHVVLPLAEHFAADAYLEAGEISDTHLFQMAAIGAEDGRPMVVLTLSDADPAGYWMPATIAWKLGALRDLCFPDLQFEVHPIGFLPEQVHEINANGCRCQAHP
jgi:hypothetical protein